MCVEPRKLMRAAQDCRLTHLMGLFEPSDMKYETEGEPQQDPSLMILTKAAVHLLSPNPLGFFLFVEGVLREHVTTRV